MKITIQKIATTLLSLIVLMSTMSFTIYKHYCGEFLVDVSYMGEADGCGMNMDSNSEDQEVFKKKCCKNESEFVEASVFQKEQAVSLKEQQQTRLVFTDVIVKEIWVRINENVHQFADIPPPDIEVDFNILYQTFLI